MISSSLVFLTSRCLVYRFSRSLLPFSNSWFMRLWLYSQNYSFCSKSAFVCSSYPEISISFLVWASLFLSSSRYSLYRAYNRFLYSLRLSIESSFSFSCLFFITCTWAWSSSFYLCRYSLVHLSSTICMSFWDSCSSYPPFCWISSFSSVWVF